MRCFKHAENNVHVRRAGYREHTRYASTAYMYVHVRRTCIIELTPSNDEISREKEQSNSTSDSVETTGNFFANHEHGAL